MLINKKTLLIFIFSVFCVLISSPVLAEDDEGYGFDPNHIISDDAMLDSTTMSVEDIQNFLEEQGSYLADHYMDSSSGFQKKVAEIIYDAAVNNYDCSRVKNMSANPTTAEKKYKCPPIKINPQFLLVLLQKEQGLIEKKDPEQGRLDWAAGYGCPDSGGCNDRWKGFGKQVNSAALQFHDYMMRSDAYTYKPGNLYTFTNQYAISENKKDTLVTPANRATAALYNYTPHVYNGNYNFYKIWNRYFNPNPIVVQAKEPNLNLIEGSLVQIEGEVGVWLIQDKKKRPFLTKESLTSRYDTSRILQIKKYDLEDYPKGNPIKFSQYSLVRDSSGTTYLLVDDTKRIIENSKIITNLGLDSEEIVEVSSEDISLYKEGKPVTIDSKYPKGALLQDIKTGGVYFVRNDEKAPIWDAVFLKTKFKDYNIIKTDKAELDQYITIDPVLFEDGELVKSSNSSAVYVISDGKKRPIMSGVAFEKIGYKWNNIITVSPKVLYLYDNGEVIK